MKMTFFTLTLLLVVFSHGAAAAGMPFPLSGELSLLTPESNSCLPQGASVPVTVDLLVHVGVERPQPSLEGASLCIIVTGSATLGPTKKCTLLSTAPPLVPPLSPGCYQIRLTIEDIGGDTLLESPRAEVFQVAKSLRCETRAPRCPARAGHIFSVANGLDALVPVAATYYPRPNPCPLFDQHLSADFTLTGQSATETLLVSNSPLHGDVIHANEIILEIGRQRASDRESKSSAGLLESGHARVCVHVLFIGPAVVSDASVDLLVNPPYVTWQWNYNASYELCLEQHGSDLSIWSAEADLSPLMVHGTRTAHNCTLRATFEADSHSEVITISVPTNLISGVQPSVSCSSSERECQLSGVVVGVQAWLLPVEGASSTPWMHGLPTVPRMVVVAPHTRFLSGSADSVGNESIYGASREVVVTADDLAAQPNLLVAERFPVLVLCHWSEDLNWLQFQKHRAVIYEKRPPLNLEQISGAHGVPRNVAGEASAFLKFIIDQYDNLPRRMVFLHSHRRAYHQEDLAILLANLPNDSEGGILDSSDDIYCNLNSVAWGK